MLLPLLLPLNYCAGQKKKFSGQPPKRRRFGGCSQKKVDQASSRPASPRRAPEPAVATARAASSLARLSLSSREHTIELALNFTSLGRIFIFFLSKENLKDFLEWRDNKLYKKFYPPLKVVNEKGKVFFVQNHQQLNHILSPGPGTGKAGLAFVNEVAYKTNTHNPYTS
ncbi:hypothetical protein Cgig2_016752 [Carnegiea gigantea]|uniref:Uncharacterized protein n=1 Tax=Carnegiea gigantea TaxID=171969 RepID=A0A9Q1KWI9_9CARY|nr:hypothetical protein Cgig2_016752 [Carnegiea gigantea]